MFTGVSGSGKSSIVFDTIAAESQRQMNATYPAFVRSRLPKAHPAVERIDNLTPPWWWTSAPWAEMPAPRWAPSAACTPACGCSFSQDRAALCGHGVLLLLQRPQRHVQDLFRPGEDHKRWTWRPCLTRRKSWNEGCVKDSLYVPAPGIGSSTPSLASSIWTSIREGVLPGGI